MQKLAEYVLERVAQAGVRHVFLVPGGGAMHLDDALAGRKDVGFVANLHEHASAVGAEAYGKLTGNLGVAIVTSGPGTTNCITGLASAWVNSAPVLFLSGQVKRSDMKGDRPLRQLGLQEVDTKTVVSPLTKYAATVTEPARIRQHLDLALHHARTGRPGPVWLDIPLDVQSTRIDPSALAPAELPTRPSGSRKEDGDIGHIVHRLQQSQRPMLLLGGGVRMAGAAALAEAAIDKLGIPYGTTWVGADLAYDSHPCFSGRPGMFAPRGANFTVQNADLLISVGARWDFATTGFSQADFARNAYRVIVDVDPAELEKLRSVADLCVEMDAGKFLRELIDSLPASWDKDRRASWVARVQDWRKRYPIMSPDMYGLPQNVSTYHLFEVLGERLGAGDVIVQGSAGNHSEMFFMSYAVKRGQRILADGSYGSMGYGLPAAIGACLAAGGRRTILVDGDGSIMPNIQELETVRRLGLPIKMLIVNNNGYSSIRTSQSRWFQRLIAADSSSGLTLPDLGRMAGAFDIPFARISSEGELHATLDLALNAPGPVMIDVRVPEEEDRRPRLSNYQKPDGTMASKPLEDLFPFLPREEFESNMVAPAAIGSSYGT